MTHARRSENLFTKKEEAISEKPAKDLTNVTRAKIFDQNLFNKKEEIAEIKGAELVVHESICSNCKDDFGIIGVRYQCVLCDNFNLCSAC